MGKGETFSLGVITGIIFVVLLSYLPISKIYKYEAAIEQCEADLPRSQECIINAIPDVRSSSDGT